MLSGRAPFHARSRDESATAVIARIKAGEFDFHASAWQSVSHEAKVLTKGNKMIPAQAVCYSTVEEVLFFNQNKLY